MFDSKLHQSEFYVYENYVVYVHVYHVRSCSPTPTYKQPLYGCQPDEPQASLATTNRCNHVYVVLFFILLFMYAVKHCLYSVGNKITTTTTNLSGNFIITGNAVICKKHYNTKSDDAHLTKYSLWKSSYFGFTWGLYECRFHSSMIASYHKAIAIAEKGWSYYYLTDGLAQVCGNSSTL